MSTCPMPVFTFLESYDFKGKIIVPFCTNEGSGLGDSISDIENTVKDATVLPGLPIRGSLVSQSDDKIKEWLNNLFSD
jgi:flavodoxin